jgi:hypothetical protein
MKNLSRLLAIMILVQSAKADQFKVHYSNHGAGTEIIVNASTSDDARHTVEDMILGAVVTGVRRNR